MRVLYYFRSLSDGLTKFTCIGIKWPVGYNKVEINFYLFDVQRSMGSRKSNLNE